MSNPFAPIKTGPYQNWFAADHQNAANYFFYEMQGASEENLGAKYKRMKVGMRAEYEHQTRLAKAKRRKMF